MADGVDHGIGNIGRGGAEFSHNSPLGLGDFPRYISNGTAIVSNSIAHTQIGGGLGNAESGRAAGNSHGWRTGLVVIGVLTDGVINLFGGRR